MTFNLKAWIADKLADPIPPHRPVPSPPSPAPDVGISTMAPKDSSMSVLTQDIRAAGFGGVLDAVEAAEKAVGVLASPGGLTPENVAAAAEASAKAASTASSAVITVEQNPVGVGAILVTDAINFLVPAVTSALTKKAGVGGTVSVSDLIALLTQVQAVIAKL